MMMTPNAKLMPQLQRYTLGGQGYSLLTLKSRKGGENRKSAQPLSERERERERKCPSLLVYQDLEA